jgi:glycerophosphoryl diester phosphodiesterase
MSAAPIIVAHRGLHRRLPENSLAAFELAVREGFTTLECDVHATRDGTPNILHDETLDRTTTGTGSVAQWTDDDLRSLRLRSSDGGVTDEPPPPLRDAVRTCGSGVQWLVEIKPPDVKHFVRDVIDVFANCPGQLAIQSFDAANLLHALVVDAQLPVAFLIEDEAIISSAIDDRWPSIHLDHRLLTKARAELMAKRGISAGVWTVNEEPDIARVLALGVHSIISDEPWRVRQAIEKRQAE